MMETLAQVLGISRFPLKETNYYQTCLAHYERLYTLGEPIVLCARKEQQAVSAAMDDSASKNVIEGQPEQLVDISFDHFAQVKLAVGTIIDVQEIPKSDKLYELTVNFGPIGTRTILSGIRKYFVPSDIVGKQAAFVVNLAPRAMMGKQSHGMLLTAKTEQGGLSIVAPTVPVPNGTVLT
jgi:methionyl-tRNA synthetase